MPSAGADGVIENAYIVRLKPETRREQKSYMDRLTTFLDSFDVKVVERSPRALTIECARTVFTKLDRELPQFAVAEKYADVDLLDRR